MAIVCVLNELVFLSFIKQTLCNSANGHMSSLGHLLLYFY